MNLRSFTRLLPMISATLVGAAPIFAVGFGLAATLAPDRANATEVRYYRLVEDSTQKALSTLTLATRLEEGASQENILAIIDDAGRTLLTSSKKPNLAVFSDSFLAELVENGACDLDLFGPCLVSEGGKIIPIGVRKYESGLAKVLIGTIEQKYKLRYIKKNNEVVLVRVPTLLAPMRELTRDTKGGSVVYTTARTPLDVENAKAQRALDRAASIMK